MAEDASIYYREHLMFGIRTIFLPYNGYLQLCNRLCAAFWALFGPALAPLVKTILALTIQSACYSFCFWTGCRYLVRSDALRAACVLIFACALCPDVAPGDSMIGSVTNSVWHLTLPGLVLLFLPNDADEGRYRLSTAAAVALQAFISLSTSFMVLMLPFAIWRAIRKDGRARWIAMACIGGGICMLLAAYIFPHFDKHSGTGIMPARVYSAIVCSWIYRVLLMTVTGRNGAIWVAKYANAGPFFFIMTLSVAALTLLLSRTTGKQRNVLLVGMYITAASIPSMLFTRDLLDYFQSTSTILFNASRYFTAAIYVLVLVLAQLAERVNLRELARAGALLLIFLPGMIGNFKIPADEDFHWKQYLPAIQKWIDSRRSGGPVEHMECPIAPKPFIFSLPSDDDEQTFRQAI